MLGIRSLSVPGAKQNGALQQYGQFEAPGSRILVQLGADVWNGDDLVRNSVISADEKGMGRYTKLVANLGNVWRLHCSQPTRG